MVDADDAVLERLAVCVRPRCAAEGSRGGLQRAVRGDGWKGGRHSYIAPAAPTWVRALVDADGTIDAIETSNHAGLASWVANIRASADEMATRIADILKHVGGDQTGRSPQRALLTRKRLFARCDGVSA